MMSPFCPHYLSGNAIISLCLIGIYGLLRGRLVIIFFAQFCTRYGIAFANEQATPAQHLVWQTGTSWLTEDSLRMVLAAR
jgi:hypothetical protein